MQINGSIQLIEQLLEKIKPNSLFILAIVILLVSSLASGLIDNVPVTLVFLPIINILISQHNFPVIPLVLAFILGINLGGNFLPQGTAADMMTLELAQKNGVDDVNYKSLTKMGALFASIHVLLGVGYLAFIIYVYPTF
jgi:Na+/H+ antiporter NhaD/arsenite permease-like protein